MLTRSASRARASSRSLHPGEAAMAVAAVRQPRRGMSFDTCNSQDADTASDANRAQRSAHYRCLETLSHQRAWSSNPDAERARESMEKAMASSMNTPRTPRRRNTYVDVDHIRSLSDADPAVNPSFQNKYQQELWTGPKTSSKEVTAEDVLHATTSGYIEESYIDPITNRRVPKKTPKRANTLPIQAVGGEDVLSSWFTPGLRHAAEEQSKKYNDLDKYGPVYWNEPDGLPNLTAEEKSKHYADLDQYSQRMPMRREFDDAPLQPGELDDNNVVAHYAETGASASGRKPMMRDFDEPTEQANLNQYAAPIGSRTGATGSGSSFSFGNLNGQSGSSSNGTTVRRASITREHDGLPEHVPSSSMRHLNTDSLNKAYEQYHEFEPVSGSTSRQSKKYDGFGTNTARLYKEASGLAGSLAEADVQESAFGDLTAEGIRSNVLRRVHERSQQRELEEAKARHQSEWEPEVQQVMGEIDGEAGEFHAGDFHRLDSDHVILSQVLKESRDIRGLGADKITFPRDQAKDMHSSDIPLNARVQAENNKLSGMNKGYHSEWQPEINTALEKIKLQPRPDGDRDAFTRFTLENIQKDKTTPLNKIADPVNKVPLAAKVAGQEQKYHEAGDKYRSQWDPVTSKATEELAEQYSKHSKSPVRRLDDIRMTADQQSQDNKNIHGLDAAEKHHRSQWKPVMKEAHDQLEENKDPTLQTLTGSYVRDFPEEFSTSWSADKDAVLRPTTKATNDTIQEPDLSSMDESFPYHTSTSRLEPSLSRIPKAGNGQTDAKTPPPPQQDSQQTRQRTGQPQLRTYKVLAYHAPTDSVQMAEALSTAEEEPSKSPADIISQLAHPAKFFPYFSTLRAEGYEMVSGNNQMLVFRQTTPQVIEPSPKMKKRSLGGKVVRGTVYVAGSAYAVGVIAEYFSTGGQSTRPSPFQ
ncbi:conserved serine-threonine rich protein [Geosmithia morbida]|uniref:Conserved serine-threonine rich protein n=1 Tax=Geosmithia morbida TaxID=1094350 RepID=A0A9P4YU10_9HYPO|nr:conserved serine-threonine rich protein [Geosmithia morbida]KAF4123083.1 conserved serine-threonine rich protein [Geosmithia morbida]